MIHVLLLIILTLNAYRQHNNSIILSDSLSSTLIFLFSISKLNLVAKFCKKNAPTK